MYVNVVFELPLYQSFTYHVPENYQNQSLLFKRVLAPFRNYKKRGIIIETDVEKPDFKIKDILEVIDNKPLFNEDAMDTAKWMSSYYLCTLGEAIFTMLPREIKEKEDKINIKEIKSLHKLNSEQEKAVNEINMALQEKIFKAFLLFGITGSGKTEVYRHVAKFAKSLGKVTIVLVPEISLTPQTVRRFAEIFGERIAVIHSRLNPREKLYHWRRIQRNEVDIVLGARSAVFAPVENLGCIIIDEEHESSYKAGDTPKYNAKQVAFYIANKKKVPLVLGSATPQIESYYHSLNGTLDLLKLSTRFAKEQKTDVQLLDMQGIIGSFHPYLISKVIERLNKNEQVILFLNRRGFVPYISCQDCGETVICDNCSLSMTYHKRKNALICHTCGHTTRIPDNCPNCESKKIDYIGSGTEKIEELLENTFTGARIQRMDLDTTRGKKGHEKLLNRLGKGEIDILIGTQMIAKGLHFPNVTLVGVIDADIALNLPDFRAGERIFSLLTQVSGRAGRGDIKGEVIIQTSKINNYVIDYASKNDYETFYKKEIEIRKENLWPPFSRVVRLILRGTKSDYVEREIKDAVLKIGKTENVELLGPSECVIYKINKNYRYQVVFRGQDMPEMLFLAKKYKDYFIKDNSVYLEIDTDPFSML